MTRIVFLGASSASFGLSMFRDLFSTRDLAGSTLVLVGRDAERLSRSERVARLLNEKSGAGLKIESTTDWRAALDGAEFVVHSTAIDRNRLWRLDFEVPRKFGIRHTLGRPGLLWAAQAATYVFLLFVSLPSFPAQMPLVDVAFNQGPTDARIGRLSDGGERYRAIALNVAAATCIDSTASAVA